MLIGNRYVCGVCGYTDLGAGDTAHSCLERLNPNKKDVIAELTTLRTQNTELQRQLAEMAAAIKAKDEALQTLRNAYDHWKGWSGTPFVASRALAIQPSSNVLEEYVLSQLIEVNGVAGDNFEQQRVYPSEAWRWCATDDSFETLYRSKDK